jgi:multimeric flavodoxin WrbA
MSCFSCKLKNGKSYGRCALKDDLTPFLNKIENYDALILGSPAYLGVITGEMKSFLERLTFPFLVYDKNYTSLFKKKIATGFIYTFGADENRIKEIGYDHYPQMTEGFFKMIFGPSTSLFVSDTYQFDDYSKYESSRFDPVAKAKRREEVFPKDCKKAFEMGAKLAGKN